MTSTSCSPAPGDTVTDSKGIDKLDFAASTFGVTLDLNLHGTQDPLAAGTSITFNGDFEDVILQLRRYDPRQPRSQRLLGGRRARGTLAAALARTTSRAG